MENEDFQCGCAVVKIASRCNINCTYCYMYNKGDETYKSQPKVMSNEVVDALLKRVRYHCLKNDVENFRFVLHGGEPLLAGKEFVREFVRKAKRALLPDTTPVFSLQTNAILIDEEWVKLFAELGISIGVSLDGPKEINDKYRIDHKGKGTYDRTVEGIKIVQKRVKQPNEPEVKLGAILVANAEADPIETYEHFKSLGLAGIKPVLPDYTYDELPPGFDPADKDHTPFGDWLIAVFDKWLGDKEQKLKVTLFQEIIELLLGSEQGTDAVGTDEVDVLVVETDGGIETVDALKVCGNGFTKEGLNVLHDELDKAVDTKLAKMYFLSKKQLCQKCMVCPVKDVCGGGFIPHRYSKENGFNNPSIYCNDLLKLIAHIQNRVLGQFPAELLEESGIALLEYEEAWQMLQDNFRNSETDLANELELESFSQ